MNRDQRRKHRAQKETEWRRIGERARELIPEWIQSKRIKELPVEVTEDVFFPKPQHLGIHFCVVCGLHGKFRLCQHIRRAHPKFEKDSAEFKVVEQVSRGITENMKKAAVDVHKIPCPLTAREYNIYKGFVDQLRAGGIPIHGHYDPPPPELTETDRLMRAMSDLRESIDRRCYTDEPGPSGLDQSYTMQARQAPLVVGSPGSSPSLPRYHMRIVRKKPRMETTSPRLPSLASDSDDDSLEKEEYWRW